MNILQCDIIKKGLIGLIWLAFFAAQPLFAAPQKGAGKALATAAEKGDAASPDKPSSAVAAAEEKESQNQNKENKPETEGGLLASDYSENDFAPKTSGSSYVWDIFKLLLVLGLMVGGFYCFFRYISKKTGITARGGDIMRTIATVPVGQNKYIQVVDLAGKLLVIGVADGGINLLTEITNKDDIDRIRLMGSPDDKSSGDGSSSFQDFLKERIGRGIGKAAGKVYERRSSAVKTYEYAGDSDDIEYIKNQNGRLKKL